MKEHEFKVQNRLGLHARPAAIFVQTTNRFKSSVKVRRGDQEVDGKSIMGILLLAAGAGTTIVITADGIDEADAIDALCRLVNGGFGEEVWNA